MSDAIRSQVEQKACKIQFGLVVTKPTSRLVAAAEVDLQVRHTPAAVLSTCLG